MTVQRVKAPARNLTRARSDECVAWSGAGGLSVLALLVVARLIAAVLALSLSRGSATFRMKLRLTAGITHTHPPKGASIPKAGFGYPSNGLVGSQSVYPGVYSPHDRPEYFQLLHNRTYGL